MEPDYTPSPIDTSMVTLPPEIDELTEKLAENAHDRWALNRFKDGWKYGDCRNDENKQHPCLVAYSDLPENEKNYDRETAMETLRAVYALGYRIVKN